MTTAKFSLLPLALCMLSQVSAEQFEGEADVSYELAQSAHPASSNSGQMTPSMQVNTPTAPPLRNGLNLFVRGEALLWQAYEENLTYVYRTDSTLSFNDLKTLDFSWDWGFRVGLGYNIPRDGWDISLTWTHIKNHSRSSERAHLDASGGGGSGDVLMPVWQIAEIGLTSTPQKAKAHWSVNLEQVDLALGREYYVGKRLTLRPNGGLRADWIFQQYNVTYAPFFSPSLPQKINMNNRYFGFGFFGGLDTDWMLGQGFSVFGAMDAAILVGFFDVDQKVTQTTPLSLFQRGKFTRSLRCGRAIFDLSLGLKWCHLFSKNSWGLTFKAGYEYHIYFDQNEFTLVSSAQPKFIKPDGDLTYQGVALTGQIDF